LVAFYDIRRGNKAGLFSKEKISKGGDEYGKGEEKRACGEEYDINKQTIYIYIYVMRRNLKSNQGSITSRSPHRTRACGFDSQSGHSCVITLSFVHTHVPQSPSSPDIN